MATQERISEDTVFQNAVDDMSMEIAQASDDKRKAPRPTVAILIALELLVMDTNEPAYWRALAWF